MNFYGRHSPSGSSPEALCLPKLVDTHTDSDVPLVSVTHEQVHELTDDEISMLREVAYDEISRVAGDFAEERLRKQQRGHSIDVIDAYLHENYLEELWPPTEENVREFARSHLAANLVHYDELFQQPHPDYDGEYDPNGVMKTPTEKFVDVIENAEEVFTYGCATAVWNGEMNGSNYLITVYAVTDSDAPEQVYSTGVSKDKYLNVVTALEELAHKYDRKYQ